MNNTYIFDIDGTIADTSHRQWVIDEAKPDQPNRRPRVNWDLFFNLAIDDKPIEHMRRLMWDLYNIEENRIVYFTGRPERLRQLTGSWLMKYNFPAAIGSMFMRPDGDHRPDEIVKLEMYKRYLSDTDNDQPLMVFDDRNKVVAMWREAGVPCMHVTDKGDF